RVVVVDLILGIVVAGLRCGPMPIQRCSDVLIAHFRFPFGVEGSFSCSGNSGAQPPRTAHGGTAALVESPWATDLAGDADAHAAADRSWALADVCPALHSAPPGSGGDRDL